VAHLAGLWDRCKEGGLVRGRVVDAGRCRAKLAMTRRKEGRRKNGRMGPQHSFAIWIPKGQ